MEAWPSRKPSWRQEKRSGLPDTHGSFRRFRRVQLPERIADHEPFDLLAVLHVLGVERIGPGLERASDDERVPQAVVIAAGNGESALVCFYSKGSDCREERPDGGQFLGHFIPRLVEFIPRHVYEFVERLDAGEAAGLQQLARFRPAGRPSSRRRSARCCRRTGACSFLRGVDAGVAPLI